MAQNCHRWRWSNGCCRGGKFVEEKFRKVLGEPRGARENFVIRPPIAKFWCEIVIETQNKTLTKIENYLENF